MDPWRLSPTAFPSLGVGSDVSCSARMLVPVLRMLAARRTDLDLVPESFWTVDANARVPLDAVHSIFEHAVERFGDEQLGLKLGRAVQFGEGSPLDYAIRSAPTVRASVEVAARCSKLFTDSFRISFETWGRKAAICLYDGFSWPVPAGDFAMSAAYKTHISDRVSFESTVECWFPYPAPKQTSEHRRAFDGSVLRFEAPFYGFVFDRSYENAPMSGADPVVHAIQCDRLETLIACISGYSEAKAKARDVIEHQLCNGGKTSVSAVAQALHVSQRTLNRKLERDGTTFTDERDSARRKLALTYVGESQRPLAEISFLLGFSHIESFHRAFKRWTGETPNAYRVRASARVTSPRQRP